MFTALCFYSPPLMYTQARFTGGTGLLALNSVGNRLGCELSMYNMVPIKEYPANENEVQCVL